LHNNSEVSKKKKKKKKANITEKREYDGSGRGGLGLRLFFDVPPEALHHRCGGHSE
jgi:hypothetical protein